VRSVSSRLYDANNNPISKDEIFRAHPDSGIARIEGIELTREWTLYRIPLKKLDLSSIKTGFVVTLTGRSTPVTIYLDSIRFVR